MNGSAFAPSTNVIRLVALALAVYVAMWGYRALRMPELTRGYDELVWQNILGEDFSPAQLAHIRTPCGQYRRNGHPRAALLAALVAVRDLEQNVLTADPDELKRLAGCAGDAARHVIERSPGNSMAWFLLSWITRLENGDPERVRLYLDRSVELAPRELYMAIKRVPLMQGELARGRHGFVRGDYRSLVEGERPQLAALLLKQCLSIHMRCESDWNAGLPEREVLMVWRALQAMDP